MLSNDDAEPADNSEQRLPTPDMFTTDIGDELEQPPEGRETEKEASLPPLQIVNHITLVQNPPVPLDHPLHPSLSDSQEDEAETQFGDLTSHKSRSRLTC